MENGKPVAHSLYFYAPNKAAPVFFAVAYAVSGLVHLWQCFHYKSFKVTALFPATCLFFAAGYAIREFNAFHYDNLDTYITSQILIYMAPPLVELANYHIIGRILYYVPYCAPIHPGRTLTTFGMLSGIVEALNGIGVAWTSNSSLKPSLRDIAQALLKASLLLQIVVIALFILLAVIFHRRCARTGVLNSRVQGPLLTLYISTALILVRCIYRTVEYFSISSFYSDLSDVSPILRYEWFFYVFEASLMLANSFLWNVRHPRRYLPEKYNMYLTQDGSTELEGSGWKDSRPFLVTAVDPFGLFTKEDPKEKPFWETDGTARV